MIRVLLLTILMLGRVAGAQIRLPRVPLLPAAPGGLPGVGLPPLAQQPLGGLTGEVGRLEEARKVRLRLLLRHHGDVLEVDPNGDPVVRSEVLAFSPTDAARARARSAGFAVLRERSLGALAATIVVLQAPRGMATARALTLLRRSDPGGTYDFNNVYTQSGGASASGTFALTASAAGEGAGAQATPLGLVDGGVGTAQPVFRGIAVHQHGCGGAVIPDVHGTEVASLMVGRSLQFGGAAAGASLYAADVYCGKPTGGAVDAIADALAWLAAQRVPVINVSLVGPPNALLGQVIGSMVGQGFLIVAAVGNDGPAAPPLYPAAYPGVIGVTAVDARRRVLLEAERGPQVMFAAPGADIPAAILPNGFETVRGTSFAAPLVTGLLAQRLRSMERDASGKAPRKEELARAAIDALVRQAIHLGAPGRNGVFGYGLIGASLPSPRPASGK
jgi:subtilisin family serine protease